MHSVQREAGAAGTRVRGLTLVVAVAFAACVEDHGLEGRPDGLPDGPSAGDERRADGLGAACVDDVYGPSLPGLPAARLGAGRYEGLVLCTGDGDTFEVDAAPGEVWRVLVPDAADGQVLERLDALGRVNEQALRTAEGDLILTLLAAFDAPRFRVRGPTPAQLYALELDDAPPPADCEGPLVNPPAILVRSSFEAGTVHLCPGQTLSLIFAAQTRGRALLCVEASGSTEVLVSGPDRASARLVDARPECFRVDFVEEVGEVDVSAFGGLGSHVRWDVREDAVGERRRERVVLGRVRVRDGVPEDFSPTGLIVSAVDPGSNVLGDVLLDALGRFSLRFWSPVGQVNAAALRAAANFEDTLITVSPSGVGTLPWSVFVLEGEAAVANAEGAEAVEALYLLDPETTLEVPALHVAATARAGLVKVAPYLGPTAGKAPPVHYHWRPARAVECGTCFVPGSLPVIELSGTQSDPDEWDQAVILHELAHYVAAVYGRDDSPGGRHDGGRVTPVLAWSEGFAHFFAAWQLDDPRLVDRRAAEILITDIDAWSSSDPLASGTSDGTARGDVSERLVGALLWDLFDGTAIDGGPDDDGLSLSAATLLGSFFEGSRASTLDFGAPGMDLTDFLQALACRTSVEDRFGLEELLLERAFIVEGLGETCLSPLSP